MDSTIDVIVIGAGASGLAAADAFRHAGISYRIVEARDRICGRVNTQDFLGFPCDMGASWIHGQDGNPLMELAKKYDVPILKCDYDDITIRLDQKTIDNDMVLPKLEVFKQLVFEYCDKMDKGDSVKDIGDRIKREHQLDDFDSFLLDVHLSHDGEAEYGLPIVQLRGQTFSDSPGRFGGDWIFPNGYSSLFKPAADGMPILLNTPISKIDQESIPDKVIVTSMTGEQFEANYDVCTLPLGILKSRMIEFKPSLTEVKQESINKIAFGTLDKIILVFDKVFWPDTMCHWMWKKEPFNSLMFALNLSKVHGVPALMFFIPQTMKDSHPENSSILEHCMNTIRHSYPDADYKIVRHPSVTGNRMRTHWEAIRHSL